MTLKSLQLRRVTMTIDTISVFCCCFVFVCGFFLGGWGGGMGGYSGFGLQ